MRLAVPIILAVIAVSLIAATAFFATYGSIRATGSAPAFSDLLPSPTPTPPEPVVFDRVSRDNIEPRSEWLREPHYDGYDDCEDRGYGGRFEKGGVEYYYLIDLPPEPHTHDVARAAAAEVLCFPTRHTWTPPGRFFGLTQGLFTLRELDRWKRQVLSDEFLAGIEHGSSDINQRLNEVMIGLRDLEDAAILRERMRADGIPQEAITFYSEPRYDEDWILLSVRYYVVTTS